MSQTTPPSMTPPPPRDLADVICQIAHGWSSSTFGWQGNEPGAFEKARADHDEEFKRRIRQAIAAVESTPVLETTVATRMFPDCPKCSGVGAVPDGETNWLCEDCSGNGVKMERNADYAPGQERGWKLHRCPDGVQCRTDYPGGCAGGYCGHFLLRPEQKFQPAAVSAPEPRPAPTPAPASTQTPEQAADAAVTAWLDAELKHREAVVAYNLKCNLADGADCSSVDTGPEWRVMNTAYITACTLREKAIDAAIALRASAQATQIQE